MGYGSALGRSPITGEPMLLLTDAQKVACTDHLNNEVLPTRFAQVETQLKKSLIGPFLCGPCITIADLSLYVFFDGALDGTGVPNGISRDLLDACPTILALIKRVESHPKVADWNRNQNGKLKKTLPAS